MNEINLCRRGCCPTVTKIDEDKYEIKDDNDNVVLLTKENIEILYASMMEL